MLKKHFSRFFLIPKLSKIIFTFKKVKISGILAVWLQGAKLHSFQVTYVMLLGVAEEKQNNCTKSLQGFFYLAG